LERLWPQGVKKTARRERSIGKMSREWRRWRQPDEVRGRSTRRG